MTFRARLLGPLLAAPLVLAGCGAEPDLHGGESFPATPEALVAVALSHLSPDPESIEFYRADEEIDDQGTLSPWIGGQLGFGEDGTLSVRVEPEQGAFDPCDERHCRRFGTATLSWQTSTEDNPGYVTVFVRRGGELRSVGYEGLVIDRDPAEEEGFPVDLDELEAIVTDPAFALETPAAAIEAGAKLDEGAQ